MPDPKDPLEARVTDLEILLAEQERLTQDLSDVIAGQWKVIDGLTRDLEQIKGRLDATEDRLETIAPPDPPPPHY